MALYKPELTSQSQERREETGERESKGGRERERDKVSQNSQNNLQS